jgi:hypothetical protein
MNRRLTPAEMDELLGAYALDAVDADEREQIEAVLEENPRARRGDRAPRGRRDDVARRWSGPDGLWTASRTSFGPGSDWRGPAAPTRPVDEKPKTSPGGGEWRWFGRRRGDRRARPHRRGTRAIASTTSKR